jgi:hypothetical protein
MFEKKKALYYSVVNVKEGVSAPVKQAILK